MTKHEWIVDTALSYRGTWYTWAGNTPMGGIDCSGLVCTCIKVVGSIRRKSDYSAQMLYDKFPEIDRAKPGDLVFWKNREDRVIHVGICVGDGLAIGASGGGRHVVDRKSAIEANAFVKVRPMASRQGLRWYADAVRS